MAAMRFISIADAVARVRVNKAMVASMLTTKELAAAAGITPQHLCRLVRKAEQADAKHQAQNNTR